MRGNKQAGFSIVEALIVIAIVGLLAGAGLVVYQHNRTKVTNAASTNQPTNKQTSTSNTQTTPQPTTYLTIKEWGVKVPLSDAIKDAYYVPTIGTSYGSDGQPNQFSLGLKSLDSRGCAATSNTSAPVLLFRASPTETDPVTGELISKEGPGVTIGSYFYGYSLTKNKGCADDSTFQTLDTAMTTAIKGTVSATAN